MFLSKNLIFDIKIELFSSSGFLIVSLSSVINESNCSIFSKFEPCEFFFESLILKVLSFLF